MCTHMHIHSVRKQGYLNNEVVFTVGVNSNSLTMILFLHKKCSQRFSLNIYTSLFSLTLPFLVSSS